MTKRALAVSVVALWSLAGDGSGCLGPDRDEPTECPAVMCDLYCEGGMKVDENGCETCACNEVKPVACMSDAECGVGARCDVQNFCDLPPGCKEGMACPAVCYGRCVPVKPEPTSCSSDAECGAGLRCELRPCDPHMACDGGDCGIAACGQCVKVEPEPTACWTDSECPAGQRCDRNYCEAPPGCDGGACPPVCYGRCVGDVSNRDAELCMNTGGKWDPMACGHAKCGQPNPCEAIIPGCNCGEGANFVPGRGCVRDPACGGVCEGAGRDERGNCLGAWDQPLPEYCCEPRPNECEGAFRDPRSGSCLGPADQALPDYCCGPRPNVCGSGEVYCDALPPTCPAPLVAGPKNGCWACYDPRDCAPQCTTDAHCAAGQKCVARTYSICGAPRPGEPACGAPDYTYSVCEAAPLPSECTSDRDCAAGTSCRPDATGRLTCQRNEACACDMMYAPVCGADGRTYSNACAAACANVRVAHEGECELTCEIACFRYQPVCGADGVTYGCGEADARCHGTTVAYEGECRASCICTREYAPVCGTDGRTYGNACEARCASATIAYAGECAAPAGCQGDAECAFGEKCYQDPRVDSNQGTCVPADYCILPVDCESLPRPLSCVGTWACERNHCSYSCSR